MDSKPKRVQSTGCLKDPKAREFYSAIKEAIEGNGERLAGTFKKLRPWQGADISPETELFMELASGVLRELTPRDRALHSRPA